MITEERLKELIENKSDIYVVQSLKNIKLKLNEKCFIDEKAKMLAYVPNEDDGELVWGGAWYIHFSKIYETEEDADWGRKFKRIARIEYLDLPSWEEVSNKKASCTCFLTNDGLNSNTYFLQVTNYSEDCNCIYIRDVYSRELFYSDKATKENYIKACEMAKLLFLGGEKDDKRR